MSRLDPNTTQINTALAKTGQTVFARLELFYQGKLKVILPRELPYTLGRDKFTNKLVITSTTVSRKHCVFELNNQLFGLRDTSTNGTYISPSRVNSIHIHNDFFPLVGQGAMYLGKKGWLDDPDIIHYRVTFDDQNTNI